MSPLNITQPLGIWSIMATIRWCPIFPKWDSYQPLLQWWKSPEFPRIRQHLKEPSSKGSRLRWKRCRTSYHTPVAGPWRAPQPSADRSSWRAWPVPTVTWWAWGSWDLEMAGGGGVFFFFELKNRLDPRSAEQFAIPFWPIGWFLYVLICMFLLAIS